VKQILASMPLTVCQWRWVITTTLVRLWSLLRWVESY